MMTLNRERNAVIKQLAESDDWQRYLPLRGEDPAP
jgi:hypothetical protein